VQQLINHLSQEPAIYGIIVYGRDGRPRYVSDPLTTPQTAPAALLQDVLKKGVPVSFEREINAQKVYSVLHPIASIHGAVIGALEIAQPLSFVDAEKASVQRQVLFVTLVLLASLALVTLWLVRRVLERRLAAVMSAVRALGRDEPAPWVPEDPGGGELAELAREFNRMTTRLEAARADLTCRAEEQVALERRLRESEKLAAVGNLAAGLAHEIAAPLNVISGRAEMLIRREAADTPRVRHLQIIVDQIGRITGIVRNLLDYARRREPRLQPLRIDSVVDDVCEFLEPETARAEVEVSRASYGDTTVEGDAQLLVQVMANLLLNAIQAMDGWDGERRIYVRVYRCRLAELPDRAASVRVEVADTGPGIRDEVRAQLFTPFVTTKARGTGLGLVVARSIVEDHGGTLDCLETVEAGACFRITLPATVSVSDG
ncbi:MAG: ATP-binding protein, partial [Chloroflexota bacterium]|nr:ATP-binding protein [Chloroflexota bacterium]